VRPRRGPGRAGKKDAQLASAFLRLEGEIVSGIALSPLKRRRARQPDRPDRPASGQARVRHARTSGLFKYTSTLLSMHGS
jgi:hypothetical protein